MKKYYERYWENQEELEDFHYKWPAVKKFIPKDKAIKLLDFGCGKGAFISEILKINPKLKITGADISNTAIKSLRKKINYLKFVLIKENRKLPFKKGEFDFITALDVIEHVYDTEEILKELRRILKPGGKILISVPYHGLIKNLIISLLFFEINFDPFGPHIRFFTKKSLVKCLEKTGLKPLETGYFGRFYPLSRGMYILAQK